MLYYMPFCQPCLQGVCHVIKSLGSRFQTVEHSAKTSKLVAAPDRSGIKGNLAGQVWPGGSWTTEVFSLSSVALKDISMSLTMLCYYNNDTGCLLQSCLLVQNHPNLRKIPDMTRLTRTPRCWPS